MSLPDAVKAGDDDLAAPVLFPVIANPFIHHPDNIRYGYFVDTGAEDLYGLVSFIICH